MNKQIVATALFAFSSLTFASDQAVKETNYSLKGDVSDSDYSNSYSLSGEIRFPISTYLGSSVSGKYLIVDQNNFINSETRSANLELFVRKNDLGMLKANFGYAHREERSNGPGFDMNSSYITRTASLSGTFYLGDTNISLTRTRSSGRIKSDIALFINGNFEKGERFSKKSWYHSRGNIGYFFTKNLLAQIDFFDNINHKAYSLLYQPAFLGNTTSIGLSYQDDSSNQITLSISYHFDSRTNLKTRNREY